MGYVALLPPGTNNLNRCLTNARPSVRPSSQPITQHTHNPTTLLISCRSTKSTFRNNLVKMPDRFYFCFYKKKSKKGDAQKHKRDNVFCALPSVLPRDPLPPLSIKAGAYYIVPPLVPNQSYRIPQNRSLRGLPHLLLFPPSTTHIWYIPISQLGMISFEKTGE